MRVVVVRAFLVGGVRQEPGTRLDLPESLGVELVAMGKAERVAEDPPPASGPMTAAGSPALVPPVAPTVEADAPAAGGAVEPQADASAPASTDQAPARRRKGN